MAKRKQIGKHYSSYIRERVWNLHCLHYTAKQIVSILEENDKVEVVTEKGVKKYIRRSTSRGHGFTKTKPRNGPAVSDEAVEIIESAIVASKGQATSREIQEKLLESGISIGTSSIRRIRNFIGYEPRTIKYCQVINNDLLHHLKPQM